MGHLRHLRLAAPAACAALMLLPAPGLAAQPVTTAPAASAAGGAAAPAAATTTPAATTPAATTPAATVPAATTPPATTPPATGSPGTTTTLTPSASGTPGAQQPGTTAPAKPAAKTGSGKSSGVSGWAILAAAIGALLLLACLVWAIFRFGAYEPHWLQSARHSVSEAGYRSSATWAEFRDWARLGH